MIAEAQTGCKVIDFLSGLRIARSRKLRSAYALVLTAGERGGGLKAGACYLWRVAVKLCLGMKLKWEEENHSEGVSWCQVEMGGDGGEMNQVVLMLWEV